MTGRSKHKSPLERLRRQRKMESCHEMILIRGNSEVAMYFEEKEGLRCKKEWGAKILLNMRIDINTYCLKQ